MICMMFIAVIPGIPGIPEIESNGWLQEGRHMLRTMLGPVSYYRPVPRLNSCPPQGHIFPLTYLRRHREHS